MPRMNSNGLAVSIRRRVFLNKAESTKFMTKGLQNLIFSILAVVARVSTPAITALLKKFSMLLVNNVALLDDAWVV